MSTILIVEDEQPIREVVAAYLQKAGYTVIEASDGAEAIEIFPQQKIDLVILDLNLPRLDGIAVCKQIRKTSQVPIIMLTARIEEMDELIGLQIGADDYIKKPFSPSVLIARVETVLKRMADTAITIRDLEIDPAKMTVFKQGKEIKLTTTQFNILYLLARNLGRVYTREEILERISPNFMDKDVLWRTVDAHIKSIRRAIETDSANPEIIVTVIGKGYKFNGQ